MIKGVEKHYEILILVCILFYISFLLFYKLWEQSLWIDEWFSSYVAKYMSINWLYKSKYFLFEWLQAICFKIGGFSDFWARFPSVIAHIFSVFLMYIIPSRLCKNKYVWLFSALIFGLLYREIWRWRDARFYSLLQFLFLWWIVLIIEWLETKKIFYLNSVIILTCLGVVFHPFLYVIWAVLLWIFVLQYKKIWDFDPLFSKKFLSTWILVVVLWICAIIYGTLWWQLNWSLTSWLSFAAKKYYFSFYNSHLWTHLWLIYAIWLLWMFYFFVRRSFENVVLFFVPFVLFVYALVVKWYALLIFPLMVLSASVFIYDLIKLIKNRYVKLGVLIIVLMWIICTANLQFLPTGYYYFDYTSPQPDFKSAHKSIPDWQNVISWFPILCDLYYSDRWTCVNAIRVDLVHDWNTWIMDQTEESYTKLSYLNTLDELLPWTYYFVIDDLTNKSYNVNKKLFDQIFEYWWMVYQSWEQQYNHILVLKVLVAY